MKFPPRPGAKKRKPEQKTLVLMLAARLHANVEALLSEVGFEIEECPYA